MRSSLVLIAAWLATSLNAASLWYVDPLAAGSNNGTSWANAWQDPTNVNWGVVGAGDTIYLSQGTYTNNLNAPSGKSGTAGNYITIATGALSPSPAGHDGLVIFTNAQVGPSSSSQYFTIDGSKSASFVGPTNYYQVTHGATAITNNINLLVTGLIGHSDSDASPVLWYITSGSNLKFRYVQTTMFSNDFAWNGYSAAGLDWRGSVIYIAGVAQSGALSNIVFEGMYSATNATQFLGGVGSLENGFDNVEFKYGYLYWIGEDHFEYGSGLSVHDSVIGPFNGLGKDHADMFQLTGSFIKIYNNDMRECGNSLIRFQQYPGLNSHDVYFFNNVTSEKVGRAPNGGTFNEPICIVDFGSETFTGTGIMSNYVIANNLFFQTVPNFDGGTTQLCNNPFISSSNNRSHLTNLFVKNFLFANNITVDKHKGIVLPATAGGFDLGTSNNVYDFNVQTFTNTALTTPLQTVFINSTFTNGTASDNLGTHDTTNRVLFVDVLNDNFELQPTDTTALNKGTNLSAIFNFDALNRPRNVSGVWDMGPLELQDTNLICWLTFDQSFTNWPDGRIDDMSGYGNHAYRWGNTNSVFPTNFPVAVYATNIAGANTNGYIAGDFRWLTNNYGLYGRWGQFAAVTNVSMFTNLANFSVMCWAHYANATRINPVYDYSVDGNAQLISAGTSAGVVGSWDMGRYNFSIWLNNTRFQLMTNGAFTGSWGAGSDPVYGADGKVIFNYPDNGFNNNGDSAVWHHYAFTFANGVAKSYYDGTNLATCDVSAVTTKMTVGWNNYLTATRAFIGIGVDTHGGDALLAPWDDFYSGNTANTAYPNNGWMDGQIDDVRIYNRTLSATEVAQIVSGQAQSGGGGGGSTPTTSVTFGGGSNLSSGTASKLYIGQ